MFGHRSRSVHDDEADVVEQEVTVRRGTAWSPAQIVGFVIGAAAVAFGVVALVRTGLDTDEWFSPVKTVLGFEHTPLLAVSEIGFGVLMLLSAMSPGGRPLMALLSAIALAFGIVVVADAWSGRIDRWFGVTDSNGWLYIVVGAIGLVAALMLPTVAGRERRHVTERRQVGGPHTAH
jgi:hypothetical protein